jgi:hypothetical protein
MDEKVVQTTQTTIYRVKVRTFYRLIDKNPPRPIQRSETCSKNPTEIWKIGEQKCDRLAKQKSVSIWVFVVDGALSPTRCPLIDAQNDTMSICL